MTQLTPFLPHLCTTLQHRPYVFIFLAFFLIFGILQLGFIRTLLFLLIGWVVAFSSEASSIRNTFPYGDYQYVYENLKGELLLFGVPLWDSLSYTFLAYASYATALLLLSASSLKLRSSGKTLFLSTLLMMGIDVIIDPVAALGERWFLGKVYYYPHGGIYFGVPLSNFAGWALVAFVIVFLFQRLDIFLNQQGYCLSENRWKGLKPWLGTFLYLGVFFFNWGITLWLKEWKLAAVDILLFLPLFIILIRSSLNQLSSRKIMN